MNSSKHHDIDFGWQLLFPVAFQDVAFPSLTPVAYTHASDNPLSLMSWEVFSCCIFFGDGGVNVSLS